MNLGQWIGLITLVVAVYILWEIRQVLLLVFVAIVLATVLNHLARWLQRWVKLRAIAVILAISILIALTVSFFALIVPGFAKELRQLPDVLPKGFNLVNSWLDQIRASLLPEVAQYIPDLDSLIEQLQEQLEQKQIQLQLQPLLNQSFLFFTSSLGAFLNVLLVLVLTLMLLANPESYRRAFIKLFPSFYRRRADGILAKCEDSLQKWIIGALIGMAVIALLSWIGLSILGVRLAVANGILAGLLNFIPNVGPTLSVILPMTIALIDAPWKALGVLILYIGIQQFESNLLTPFIMAQQVSLLPAVTLSAQIFFTIAFGPLGLVMSIPLTVVAQIWIKEVLIRDVLDRWYMHPKREVELAIVSESPQIEEVTEQQTDEKLTSD
ncbi:MAG: AI-2E family transporter [Cyanosarcina radialis HA8281-LM2]|jgi:predicted PurR-regulated permease PerM|nr:AI-2E family transporter [Cyanosarcina radialis HA8281-LM2]